MEASYLLMILNHPHDNFSCETGNYMPSYYCLLVFILVSHTSFDRLYILSSFFPLLCFITYTYTYTYTYAHTHKLTSKKETVISHNTMSCFIMTNHFQPCCISPDFLVNTERYISVVTPELDFLRLINVVYIPLTKHIIYRINIIICPYG